MAKHEAGNVSGANPATDQLVNEHEAAAVLGLSVKTLRRWRWARRGVPWIKIGSAVRYAPTDLRTFIAEGRQETEDSHAP